jgi:thioesterase domain-containing protein
MNAATDLEQRIRRVIPLSDAMQFSIRRLSLDAIQVTAPLEPNINIHGTGFAGSIYSLGVLTGWALCTHIMAELGIEAELVVARAEIRYRKPVSGDLECSCACTAVQRESFRQGVAALGKGKLVLDIEVGADRQAVLQATYIAVANQTVDPAPCTS